MKRVFGSRLRSHGGPWERGKFSAELKTTVARITELRTEIDVIVAQIEGDSEGAEHE